MQLTIVLTLSFVACAFAGTTHFDAPLGWFVPQVDGSFAWLTKPEYELSARAIELRSADVKFYLYTMSNPKTAKHIPVNDASGLSGSHYNKAHPTRFLIHGWLNDYKSEMNTLLRDALLAKGSYNVISVDWSVAASTSNYVAARDSVPEVGKLVANFIDFLNQRGGMSFADVSVIGHSLGAHVAGYSGKLVKRGRLHSIFGLDPALPLFSYSDCATRLCSTDANFVESIQTNGGLKGFLQPIGKAAFYPNGGRTQPGCGADVTGSCAHARSYIYYAEAIRRDDFPSMKCSTYEKAVDKNCGSTYSSVRMGAPSNYGISGYYYVPVRSTSSYGMGA